MAAGSSSGQPVDRAGNAGSTEMTYGSPPWRHSGVWTGQISSSDLGPFLEAKMKSTRSYGLVCGLLLVGIAAPAASLSAAISLELRPAFQVVNPGDYADLELYAVATSGSDELM